MKEQKKLSKGIRVLIYIGILISVIVGIFLFSYLGTSVKEENTEIQKNKRIVVLVSIDGLGSNLLSSTNTPFLQSLIDDKEILSTLEMKTLVQSETMPSHISMVTGLTQNHHGFYTNTLEEDTPILDKDTIFDYALDNGYSYYAFLTKSKLIYLLGGKEGENIVIKEEYSDTVMDDIDTMVEDEEERILVFIHLKDIDSYGHEYGWESKEQLSVLKELDRELELMVDDFRDEYSDYERYFIFTADHGGEGKQHSDGCYDCRRIPFILFNDDSPSYNFKNFTFSIYDVACVVLKLMHVTETEHLDCVLDTDFSIVNEEFGI
ncbi:MAG: alkaline phosphatase family protein [Candidatus Dojkabacteria bacterium]|nr:alkaline phosphatase family protein [Candidatus Dojkabacteria bacterium]